MQMLSCLRLISNLFFIIVVLCIAKTEQRAASKYENAIAEEAASEVEGFTSQGFSLLKSLSFFRASIPLSMYECLSSQSLLRCMKIYILQKMEAHKEHPRTGNLTRDFLDQFISNDTEMMSNSVMEQYAELSDQELTKRLVINFQEFFKNSNIKLHFLPGMIVKIVPSKDNKLKFSLKRPLKHIKKSDGRALKASDEIDNNTSIESLSNTIEEPVAESKHPEKGQVKKRKNKKEGFSYKNTILQMAVPVMVMPSILLGSILPFLLPVLKMATIMTLLMNNSAFIAALIYAARVHANAQDEQHISYGSHPISYH